MKHFLYHLRPASSGFVAIAILLASPVLCAQGADTIVPRWQVAFENLDTAQQTKYREHLFEASRLFNQKRVIESLNKVAEAESIFDGGPAPLNIKGACYVELRNFEGARAIFQQALDLQKEYLEGAEKLRDEERYARLAPVIPILFNLAEMDFVTEQWQPCHDRLERILKDLSPEKVAMRRLVEFKYMLCKLKLSKVDEARALAEKYDYLDDNPYYYYANSAIAYFDGDTDSAERWRASASRVFRKPEVLAPWEDTMVEFGYVKSFYGDDLKVEPEASEVK